MKKCLFSGLLFFVLSSTLSAQYGINLGYKTFSAPGWENSIDRISSDNGEVQQPLSSGLSFGIDYWFRLKNKRIEFLPELNYSRFAQTWSNNESATGKISSTFYSLYLNTNFYIFDLAGDCDCPTFSKDGDIMKKGFFVQVSPGLSLVQNKYDDLVEQEQKSASAFTPSIGIGAGLDIGLSDFLTITPIVSYRYHFGVEWSDFHTYFDSNPPLLASDNTTGISTISFGLHATIRLDELNRY